MLIRTGLKRVLGLPQSTSTERLLELGLHNTIDEIIEAHSAAQVYRLSSTRAGVRILDEAGIRARHDPEDKVCLPKNVSSLIKVEPIPRNIHPVHNEGRRRARAKAILKNITQQGLDALFVDAARYDSGDAFALSVVDAKGNLVNAASVRTKSAHEAEEAAIALAVHSAHSPSSSSRTRVRPLGPFRRLVYRSGRIGLQSTRSLISGKPAWKNISTSHGSRPTWATRSNRTVATPTNGLTGWRAISRPAQPTTAILVTRPASTKTQCAPFTKSSHTTA